MNESYSLELEWVRDIEGGFSVGDGSEEGLFSSMGAMGLPSRVEMSSLLSLGFVLLLSLDY